MQRLLELKQEVAERVDALVERAGVKAAEQPETKPAPKEDRKETSAQQERQAPKEERKEPSAQSGPNERKEPSAQPGQRTEFKPLIEVAQDLGFKGQNELEVCLYRVAAGHAVADVMPSLTKQREALVTAGAPAELGDAWLALLSHPDREYRGAFALWFHRVSRLPSFGSYLNMLRKQDLPPKLREKVDALWESPMPGKSCIPDSPVGEPSHAPS